MRRSSPARSIGLRHAFGLAEGLDGDARDGPGACGPPGSWAASLSLSWSVGRGLFSVTRAPKCLPVNVDLRLEFGRAMFW